MAKGKTVDELYDIVDNNTWNFSEIEKKLTKPNFFRILSIETKETRHSNFLAYVFDENQNHKLGTTVLHCFFDNINCPYLKSDHYTVEREKYFIDNKGKQRYIDILLVGNDNIVCIENKVLSFQHDGQLGAYETFVKQLAKEKNKKVVLIYLTPTKEDVNNPAWWLVSYEPVYKTINTVYDDKKDKLDIRLQVYFEDYLDVLRRDIMHTDEEFTNKCWDIVEANQEAFLTVYNETIGREMDLIREIVLEILQKYQYELIPQRESAKTEFKFVTPKLKATKETRYANHRLWQSSYKMVYWFTVTRLNDVQGGYELNICPVVPIGKKKSYNNQDDKDYADDILKAYSVSMGEDKIIPINAKKTKKFGRIRRKNRDDFFVQFEGFINDALQEFEQKLTVI